MRYLQHLTAKPRAFVSLTGLTPAAFGACKRSSCPPTGATAARPTPPAAAAGRAGAPLRPRPAPLPALGPVLAQDLPHLRDARPILRAGQGNVRRNFLDVMETLGLLDYYPYDRVPQERAARPRPLEAVMEAFPAVRLVTDSKEQCVHRPGSDHERQKPFPRARRRRTRSKRRGVGPDSLIESANECGCCAGWGCRAWWRRGGGGDG